MTAPEAGSTRGGGGERGSGTGHGVLRSARRDRRLPPAAVLASVGLHAAVGLAFLGTAAWRPRPLPAQTYRVRLVAAADERAPTRLKPEPPRVAEEEHRPPPPQPTPERRPETTPPTVKKEVPPPDPSREPAKAPEEGTEEINVQLDGARFVEPGYLENIIRQIHRYWRPPAGGRHLDAEVRFVIEEDGSVSDIEWIRRSGSLTFDLEARGAVEAAGRARAFGPLPEAYRGDRLPVRFFFRPASR